MCYIYWRRNPQLKNGGYCTVFGHKIRKDKISSFNYELITKVSNRKFAKAFPNGVHGYLADDIQKQLVKV